MKYFASVLFVASLAFANPLLSQETSQGSPSAEQSALIGEAERLGLLLYRHDQAAWHTTDAMLETIRDPASRGVRGWVINQVAGGLEVVFYRTGGEGFEAVWSGIYDGQAVGEARQYAEGERRLVANEVAMITAIDATFSSGADYSLCSERLNRVILPTGKEDGGLYVYLLAPQPDSSTVPFGGHFRFEVVDGQVVDHRKFTNSCLTMPMHSQGEGSPEALFVTHILDDVPTEIHVFSMYVAKMPIYVSTTSNGLTWSVESTGEEPSIRQVELD